jgi:hypothetical protein
MYCILLDCITDDNGQSSYPIVNTTDGRVCQPWTSQSTTVGQDSQDVQSSGDIEVMDSGYMFGAGSGNMYCRNPDNKPGGLWCKTLEPVWEQCNITLCYGMLIC